MYKADNIVNIYACKAATNNSKIETNNAYGTETAPKAAFLKININEIILKIIMCPAVIFAIRRMVNENGLVNIPIISNGIIIGFSKNGTGGQKICFQ